MPRSRILKLAIFCHRWMGVFFGILFTWWFVSGIFMMYWDYPNVGPEDRLARSQPLEASQVKLSPQQAYATLEQDSQPDGIRLAVFDGRPAYWFRVGRAQGIVYADTGEQTESSPEQNLRIAAAWTGQPSSAARVEVVPEPDQWTLGINFRALEPVLKYSWANGEQVYLSDANGEVIQYTTRSSRLFAYLGAIPHWLYFTPLRTNGRLWSKIVIWSSGIATVAALLGLMVGILMFSPSKRYRFAGGPTAIPYTGQKRLHMILGLFFGIVTCTWAFSGMLSMEPFPLETGGEAAPSRIPSRIPGALRGGRLQMSAFGAKHPQEALSQVASELHVKQLDFWSFAGEPVYLAAEDSRRTRIIPVRGEPMTEFDRDRIADIVTQASPPNGLAEVRLIAKYDAYYRDRHHALPLPVMLVRLNDGENTRYYIDPRSARIGGNYSSRTWMSRWLYHGLHSIDLPWLYNYRPAWDIVVLVLMLGGVSLCVTSVIIGFQLLTRKLSFRRSQGVAGEAAEAL
jgi:hypothetical protein